MKPRSTLFLSMEESGGGGREKEELKEGKERKRWREERRNEREKEGKKAGKRKNKTWEEHRMTKKAQMEI